MVELAAKAESLPLEFFARVIWQESRFQPDAIGPLTRSGQHAQGIAQFMPGTASERRLLDPFDPVQALPKSAEYLNELRGQFGNLGLAAAAYNAGPRRVQDWLDGKGSMPSRDAQLRCRDHGIADRGLGCRRQERQTASAATIDELPRVDGAIEARAQSLCHGTRTAREARGRQAMGRATRRRLQPRPRLGHVRTSHPAARRRDRRPRSKSVGLGMAQPRHPDVLSSADRCRYARGSRWSLQPDPARRRRLPSCCETHARKGTRNIRLRCACGRPPACFDRAIAAKWLCLAGS